MKTEQTVIVYRSQFERDHDQFWYDFFINYPWVLYTITGIVVGGLILFLGVNIYEWWNKKKWK